MAHLIRLDLKSAKAERSVRAECGKSYFNSRLFFCLGGEVFFGKGGGGKGEVFGLGVIPKMKDKVGEAFKK